ncbi:MAG: tetratricopeptide repeat protein [Bdellovibrionales bacterium]|nr:tetratricopeptide repeat protein [Bdellovibrionales bacterium]
MTNLNSKNTEKIVGPSSSHETFTELFVSWLEKYSQVILALGITIFAIALVWLGYGQWMNYREKKASTVIYKLQSELDQLKSNFSKLEGEKKKSLDVDFMKTYGEKVHELKHAIYDYPHSNAAIIAALDLGTFLSKNKLTNQAIDLLKQLKVKNNETLAAMLDFKIATLEMDERNYKESLALLEKIGANKNYSFLHGEALVKKGLALQKLGQFERAREIFQRIGVEYPDSESSRLAKGYLRLMLLEQRKN